ncbi:hypothetical protein F5B22DRAFT_592771 [Xylaria bambusicola]|uniref:uncharacterized protein n=1 Tax=Xylaria bambusicola TaxID=326684 RepID=UPI0020089184|nr:uncharacterized protein F5B22DRAFT_592771 [Xylaria bambusicola]KAI0522099.1 hypothetical protein F5B22DRAFT_592771 [Xylaria bambusicola]
MPDKRKRAPTDNASRSRALKRSRHTAAPDLLSPLSDELLVRILSFLPLHDLLNLAPVSDRFYHLSGDSQIWKRLYYSRFVLPRALRLPGFRNGSARDGKLHYSSRRAIWADGRRGGWVDMHSTDGPGKDSRNWKSQYKLRHNWAKGQCAVEELPLGDEPGSRDMSESPKVLVKVLEGIAVTGDAITGLRAWDLKTKQLIAQTHLDGDNCCGLPNCMALDGRFLQHKRLDIAVGFADGSFGTWRLHLEQRSILQRYRHEASSNGEIIEVAYMYPYLLTATRSILISLYTFEVSNLPNQPRHGVKTHGPIERGPQSEIMRESRAEMNVTTGTNTNNTQGEKNNNSKTEMSAPYLLTSLNSHTSHTPLALSLREMTGSTVASIAYTFSTLGGWSLGIQELHIRPAKSGLESCPEITTTQLAYTTPVNGSYRHTISPPSSPARQIRSGVASDGERERDDELSGPISLSYMHPYLLATLPDNTLILHLCTSSSSSLSVSPGIRLWGHTSGISDAEITARGKAVSVSCRGEEIRVWELEGRTNGRSIEIRPNTKPTGEVAVLQDILPEQMNTEWDDRRNWVGFDDEMVIVLKESKGRESLLVYDFT